LDHAYARGEAEGHLKEASDVRDLKLIIFSDHHKGERNDADDFWRCEAAYNAALGYYLRAEYRLIVLGDGEELWESLPEDVVGDDPVYARTLELEGRFLAARRYTRVWGNHDDQWGGDSGALKAALKVPADVPFQVFEGLTIELLEGGDGLGRLFLTHGHQGTLESDKLAPISKLLVRYGWSNAQRWLRKPWNTPSRDHALRGRHNEAMYQWAEAQRENLILITGHTHQPVFRRRDRAVPTVDEFAKQLTAWETQHPEDQEGIAERSARLEAERVLQSPLATPDLAPVRMDAPYYFNTGCCSFGDGAVTGIEISGGEIRLVRWPWPYGEREPEREILDKETLAGAIGAVKNRKRTA
jgi:predicted phosphodiesterase